MFLRRESGPVGDRYHSRQFVTFLTTSLGGIV
jgi:hypothetical protein